MTTKELMLGDYITLADCFNDGKEPLIFKVVGLGYDDENSALVLLNGEKACDIVEIDDEWCGIPITPEILEKNGFMKKTDGIWPRYVFVANIIKKCPQTVIEFVFYDYGVDADTLFECWITPDNCDGENNIHICDLKYVHQMQHALRLCGIDKEIEL